MSKYLYRLWFPMLGIHGVNYNKICEECQDLIELEIEDGYVLPTTVSLDTSLGLSLKLGWKVHTIDFCKKCSETFRQWFAEQDYVHFGQNESVQIWRNKRDDAE